MKTSPISDLRKIVVRRLMREFSFSRGEAEAFPITQEFVDNVTPILLEEIPLLRKLKLNDLLFRTPYVQATVDRKVARVGASMGLG